MKVFQFQCVNRMKNVVINRVKSDEYPLQNNMTIDKTLFKKQIKWKNI